MQIILFMTFVLNGCGHPVMTNHEVNAKIVECAHMHLKAAAIRNLTDEIIFVACVPPA